MSIQSVWCEVCYESLGLMVTSSDLYLFQHGVHHGHRLWVGPPGVDARPTGEEAPTSTEEKPSPTPTLDEPYPIGGRSYKALSMPERLQQTQYWTSKGKTLTLYAMGPDYLQRAMWWLESHAEDLHRQWYHHIHVASWMLEQRAVSTGREFMGLEAVVVEISEMDPKEWVMATPMYRAMVRVKAELEAYFNLREEQYRNREPSPDSWVEDLA